MKSIKEKSYQCFSSNGLEKAFVVVYLFQNDQTFPLFSEVQWNFQMFLSEKQSIGDVLDNRCVGGLRKLTLILQVLACKCEIQTDQGFCYTAVSGAW